MVRRSRALRTGLLLLAFCAGCGGRPNHLRLIVENGGTAPLDSVVVLTTGYRYPIGALAPGEQRIVAVEAEGESHFEIEYGRAERRRLNLGGYFERGYVGTYFARVRHDSVVLTRDSVTF
jgi:hypothetical protein